MKTTRASVLCFVLVGIVPTFGCAEKAAPTAKSSEAPRLCSRPSEETYAVFPVGNKTKSSLELAGASDLLMNTMTNSGCFTVLEREQLKALIDEMNLCSEKNLDRGMMDCENAAKPGHLMGAKHKVFSEVTFFEPNVKGAELGVKIPGISLAGIDLAASYAALTLGVRVVSVETGKIAGSTVVHALLPSEKYAVGIKTDAINISAAVRNKTPFGEELERMLERAVQNLSNTLPGLGRPQPGERTQ